MEFLVRIVDRSDREDDSKRGDVLCAQPDGWAWSQAELVNPDWRIVSVRVLQSTVDAFLSQATRTDRRFRRREWYLDFTEAPTPSDFDFTGSRPVAIITMTRQEALRMVKQKPAMV
ncbi:MAG: hypothetical protein IT518_04690 [Burkholderiales bacterium]|nr:hypothetical protein [Burkholderiales bacterium]